MMMGATVGSRPVTGGNPYGPPVAHWNSPQTVVPLYSNVSFFDDSSGFPTSWEWHFGGPDGPIFAITRNAQYYFTQRGVFPITLVAINSYGSDFYVSQISVGQNEP